MKVSIVRHRILLTTRGELQTRAPYGTTACERKNRSKSPRLGDTRFPCQCQANPFAQRNGKRLTNSHGSRPTPKSSFGQTPSENVLRDGDSLQAFDKVFHHRALKPNWKHGRSNTQRHGLPWIYETECCHHPPYVLLMRCWLH